MPRKFLLAHLSERGPGILIEDLILKARRNGFKQKEVQETLIALRVERTVEQIGQYLWLKKGVAECIGLEVKKKKYRVISYASRVG